MKLINEGGGWDGEEGNGDCEGERERNKASRSYSGHRIP